MSKDSDLYHFLTLKRTNGRPPKPMNPQPGVGSGADLIGKVQGGAGATDGCDHGQVAVLAGDVQRRVAVAVLLVGVAAVVQQAADHLHLAPPHRQVQRRVAVLQDGDSRTSFSL